MVNIKDLWIGDELVIKSSGRVCRFEGIHANGKARLNSNGKIYLASAKNLKIYDPKSEEPILDFNNENPKKMCFTDFPKSIDLHIEKLKPDLINALPERIIDFQIKSFETYLESALKLGINDVVIIHGKGRGVLKQSIISLIKNDNRIRLYTEVNAGGALELLL